MRKLTKPLVKHRFYLHMYSTNIPMAEKRIVCFQSKKSENMYILTVILNSTNYYMYLKRYFEIFDIVVYSGGQLLLL